jgi:hypothetical protein
MDYTLEKLEVYNLAEEFSDEIWDIVEGWKIFLKDTIGKQLVRSADSISANIAEGYGRYYYKESKQFYFFPGVLFKRQNPGSESVSEEKSLNIKSAKIY